MSKIEGFITLAIERREATFPVLHSRYGIIVDSRLPGRPTEFSTDYEKIARANGQTANGYRALGVHEISAAKGIGYCWESGNADQSRLYISCSFDKVTLGASYSGSTAYREEFYKVISQISTTP